MKSYAAARTLLIATAALQLTTYYGPRAIGVNAFILEPRLQQHRMIHRSSPALFMMADLSYMVRKASFGIEDKDVLKNVMKEAKDVVLVDVRNPDEIAAAPCPHPGSVVEGRVLLADDGTAVDLLPNKNRPHIVFCAKGGRASKACQRLKELGYSEVYNAGGVGDLNLFLD